MSCLVRLCWAKQSCKKIKYETTTEHKRKLQEKNKMSSSKRHLILKNFFEKIFYVFNFSMETSAFKKSRNQS